MGIIVPLGYANFCMSDEHLVSFFSAFSHTHIFKSTQMLFSLFEINLFKWKSTFCTRQSTFRHLPSNVITNHSSHYAKSKWPRWDHLIPLADNVGCLNDLMPSMQHKTTTSLGIQTHSLKSTWIHLQSHRIIFWLALFV